MRSTAYPALSCRNFRLLWSGQSVSLIGTMMQNAAVLWHVSLLAEPGQKAIALGLVGLVRVVPILAFAMVGGVLADAFDRRKTMIVTQSAMALFALALAVLTTSGHATLSAVYVLTALTAAASAIDGPARSSLVPSLVPREHLASAVSLNTTLFQLASVIGPSLGGVALIWLDVGWVYVFNALSFTAVIGSLLMIRDLPARTASERAPVTWSSAVEGLRFVFGTPLIRSSMLLDFNACFFSSATALLPIFAADILQVGPAGFGWLYAAPSIGAVAASTWLVRNTHRVRRRGMVLVWAVVAYGVATVVFGASSSFPLTIVSLMVVGAADTINMVLRNVIRQMHTPDQLRGRMVGVNLLFAQGGPQLGEFEAGSVAQIWSAPISVITGGIACLAATAWIAWESPELRGYGAETAAVPEPAPQLPAATPHGTIVPHRPRQLPAPVRVGSQPRQTA